MYLLAFYSQSFFLLCNSYTSIFISDEPSLENRVKVSVSPSSIAIATGDQATIVCVFGGINVSDCTVTWRVNGTDITNTTSAGNFLMRTDGNSSFLIFKQCISALSGSYSCELSEYPSIQSPHVPVTIEQGTYVHVHIQRTRRAIISNLRIYVRTCTYVYSHHIIYPIPKGTLSVCQLFELFYTVCVKQCVGGLGMCLPNVHK